MPAVLRHAGRPIDHHQRGEFSDTVMLTPRLIAVTDDWNHRVVLIDRRSRRIVWQYGHRGVAGSGPGYLNEPGGLDLVR